MSIILLKNDDVMYDEKYFSLKLRAEIKDIVTEATIEALQKLKIDLNNQVDIKEEETPIQIEEVCMLLNISKVTANSWMRQGVLPFHRMGKRIYFFRSEVLTALKNRKKFRSTSK